MTRLRGQDRRNGRVDGRLVQESLEERIGVVGLAEQALELEHPRGDPGAPPRTAAMRPLPRVPAVRRPAGSRRPAWNRQAGPSTRPAAPAACGWQVEAEPRRAPDRGAAATRRPREAHVPRRERREPTARAAERCPSSDEDREGKERFRSREAGRAQPCRQPRPRPRRSPGPPSRTRPASARTARVSARRRSHPPREGSPLRSAVSPPGPSPAPEAGGRPARRLLAASGSSSPGFYPMARAQAPPRRLSEITRASSGEIPSTDRSCSTLAAETPATEPKVRSRALVSRPPPRGSSPACS